MREVQAQEKEINGVKYRVMPLGVAKGKAVLYRLNRVIGPAIASGLDSILSAGGDPKRISIVALAPAWRELVDRLSEEDFDFIVSTMVETTDFAEAGGWAQLSNFFEFHFRAAYDELLLWLVFCLEVNYGSFLSGIKRVLSSLKTKDQSMNQSESPST